MADTCVVRSKLKWMKRMKQGYHVDSALAPHDFVAVMLVRSNKDHGSLVRGHQRVHRCAIQHALRNPESQQMDDKVNGAGLHTHREILAS